MESISTKNLCYSLGNKPILQNINLQVPQGSIYGYLGRNGAGKSTTIKLLLGLLNQEEDNIFIQNKSLQKEPTAIHALSGNLIEAPCYYSKLTVYENLKYLDIIHSLGNKRIDEVLHSVDLLEQKNKLTSALSMGMKQRLGIAIAIFHHPELLILDEPLNGLDPQGIYEMRTLFQRLNDEGKTIFLSSHILSELEKVATHIGIIEEGKMLYQGTKTALLQHIKRSVKLKINNVPQATILLQSFPKPVIHADEHSITIEIDNDKEFNAILQYLVKNQIDIYNIETNSTDLENIFLQLIATNHAH